MFGVILVVFFAAGAASLDVALFPGLPDGIIDSKNTVCREQSRLYVEHLRNLSLWAYEMKDSTAKSVTGILTGSIWQYGQFQECLEARAPYATQYCLTAVEANVPPLDPPRDPKSLIYDPNESVLRRLYDHKDPSQQARNVVLLGWCVPASCTPNDLEIYLNNYLRNTDFPLKGHNVTYTAHIEENSCQKQGENSEFDHVDIAFCLVVLILLLLVVVSTICEILWSKENEKLKGNTPIRKLATSFSIKTNFKKLSKFDESSPALSVLYGMRVICIIMIITDHRFGTSLSTGILNFNVPENQYRSSFGTLFFHGDLFVDSFFIISGILVTYCLLSQYEKKILNPGFVILMRYVRLTPLYAFVIFYYASIFNHLDSGPMWKTVIGPEVQDCRNNWWTNLLYISNYVNVEHMCMVHSWYLPCDFHYFIIAVVLCIVIHREKKIGLSALAVLTVVSILIPFCIVIIYQRPAVMHFYPEFLRGPKTYHDFLLSYSKSHARASPYFVGMIAGYLYYRMKGSVKFLKEGYSHLILVASLCLMGASILTGMVFYDPYHEYNALEAASYAALHRTVWSIGSVGVLYTASYGHARFVFNLLSWKPFVSLSKLVYGAYLMHMQFQLRVVGSKGAANYTSYFTEISNATSDVVLAFGIAFVMYLVIEAPFRNLISLLLVPSKQNKTNKSAETVSESSCDSQL